MRKKIIMRKNMPLKEYFIVLKFHLIFLLLKAALTLSLTKIEGICIYLNKKNNTH